MDGETGRDVRGVVCGEACGDIRTETTVGMASCPSEAAGAEC